MWTEKCPSNAQVGIKLQNKRIFKRGIRNQSCALLLLDLVYAENDKNRNAQSVLCELGVFFYARKYKEYGDFT